MNDLPKRSAPWIVSLVVVSAAVAGYFTGIQSPMNPGLKLEHPSVVHITSEATTCLSFRVSPSHRRQPIRRPRCRFPRTRKSNWRWRSGPAAARITVHRRRSRTRSRNEPMSPARPVTHKARFRRRCASRACPTRHTPTVPSATFPLRQKFPLWSTLRRWKMRSSDCPRRREDRAPTPTRRHRFPTRPGCARTASVAMARRG